VQDTVSTAYDLHFAPAGHHSVASKVSRRTHTKKKHKSKSTATSKTRGTATARMAVVSPFRQQAIMSYDRSVESASDSTAAAPSHEVSHPVNAQCGSASVDGCDSCAPCAAERGPPSPEPVAVPLDTLVSVSQPATRSTRWDCKFTHNNRPVVVKFTDNFAVERLPQQRRRMVVHILLLYQRLDSASAVGPCSLGSQATVLKSMHQHLPMTLQGHRM
jgi:hypothetical protein